MPAAMLAAVDCFIIAARSDAAAAADAIRLRCHDVFSPAVPCAALRHGRRYAYDTMLRFSMMPGYSAHAIIVLLFAAIITPAVIAFACSAPRATPLRDTFTADYTIMPARHCRLRYMRYDARVDAAMRCMRMPLHMQRAARRRAGRARRDARAARYSAAACAPRGSAYDASCCAYAAAERAAAHYHALCARQRVAAVVSRSMFVAPSITTN